MEKFELLCKVLGNFLVVSLCLNVFLALLYFLKRIDYNDAKNDYEFEYKKCLKLVKERDNAQSALQQAKSIIAKVNTDTRFTYL